MTAPVLTQGAKGVLVELREALRRQLPTEVTAINTQLAADGWDYTLEAPDSIQIRPHVYKLELRKDQMPAVFVAPEGFQLIPDGVVGRGQATSMAAVAIYVHADETAELSGQAFDEDEVLTLKTLDYIQAVVLAVRDLTNGAQGRSGVQRIVPDSIEVDVYHATGDLEATALRAVIFFTVDQEVRSD